MGKKKIRNLLHWYQWLRNISFSRTTCGIWPFSYALISALISSSVISETPAALAASLISCMACSARVALYSFTGSVMLNGMPFT